MVCFYNALVGDMKKWKAQQIGTKSKCYAPRGFVAACITFAVYQDALYRVVTSSPGKSSCQK